MKQIIIITMTIIMLAFLFSSCNNVELEETPTTADSAGDAEPVETATTAQEATNETVSPQDTVPNDNFDISKATTDENGCYDSEGGLFYEKKGYIIDVKGDRYEDECVSKTSLNEVYCGIVGYKDVQSYRCDFGCKDGVCIEGDISEITCIDTDYDNYETKGKVSYQGKEAFDYCSKSNTLMEQICTNVGIPSEDEKYCKYGCEDGACKPGSEEEQDDSSCADSDLGPDKEYIKGNVTDPKGIIEDECLNSNTVKEYHCGIAGYRDSSNIECDNGCLDGACVR